MFESVKAASVLGFTFPLWSIVTVVVVIGYAIGLWGKVWAKVKSYCPTTVQAAINAFVLEGQKKKAKFYENRLAAMFTAQGDGVNANTATGLGTASDAWTTPGA
ncbi:MAG: hypothetical protein LLG00_16715 [Planctomycetaceae bacterium]|nr:hypothetical protein [Planctomycetaceae bacterium]